MEIYNETVTDLLVDSWKRKPLEIRETMNVRGLNGFLFGMGVFPETMLRNSWSLISRFVFAV